jgi:hypothetical protein
VRVSSLEAERVAGWGAESWAESLGMGRGGRGRVSPFKAGCGGQVLTFL